MSAYAIVIFILIILYTFYMGINDGSIAIATTVATRAVKPRTAIIVAAIVKFVTPIIAFYIGSSMAVAGNISSNLIFSDFLDDIAPLKAFIFLLSGMIGAMVWGGIAYILKIPNSISHTLLGGIIGSAIACFGFSSIKWTQYVLINVVLMVVLAPLIGMLVGFVLMKIIKRLARSAPRGISKILIVLQRINLVVLSAGFSSNNTQKSIGVFLMMTTLGLASYGTVPIWAVIAFALALTLGLICGGSSVMNTVGRKIFKLQDVHSVTAQLTTSIVMLLATQFGIAVSTGQVMSSSIMGVGASERFRSVKWGTAMRIVVSWVLTLPIAASIGALVYLIIGKLILRL